MSPDLTELAHVARVLEEAHTLLKAECERLEQLYGPTPKQEVTAGSPMQTLHGIRDLEMSMASAIKQVALAAGYTALGLDRTEHALAMARRPPVSFPSGADRMARPLGEDTVRALEMIRDLGYFDGDTAVAIDVALAAPEATYPPDDWDAWAREQRWRAQSD
ncbi:hypothetical protein GTW59_06380 [Streptomyces sp. SID89]|nr:hypothetical protein [Streptomyces sp. SID89]